MLNFEIIGIGADFVRKNASEEVGFAAVEPLDETCIRNRDVLRRMRIHWISNLVHDLRGPLFAARGYARLLLDEHLGNVTVTQRKYLNSVVDNVNKMSNILNHLHEFPADGSLDLDTFSLRDVLVALAAPFRGASPALRFVAELPAAPLHTVGDRAKLTGALHKLLDATFEFTLPSGTVEMLASERHEELTLRLRGSRDSSAAPSSAPCSDDVEASSAIMRLHGGAASIDCVPGRTYHVTVRLPLIR